MPQEATLFEETTGSSMEAYLLLRRDGGNIPPAWIDRDPAERVWRGRAAQHCRVAPLTTSLVEGDAFPLRVRVRADICQLAKHSDILVDQILTWDNNLFRTDLGPLPEALQEEVRRALLEFLDLG